MLFNYDKCECCKKQRNDINVELSNLLPSNICNKITENNINCKSCSLTHIREQDFMKVYDLHDYDKFYVQLKFFLKYSKEPQLFNWQCSTTHYNENMDKLFKNEELIQRFGEGFKDVKKYRAFAKKNREMFIWIDHNIFRIETIQEILKEWGVSKAKYFKYYGKKHSVVLLICLILWEMIYSRIGKENIKYIDEEEIGKYVDNIMEDYLPKK